MGITHELYITIKGSSPHKQVITVISVSKGNMYSSKQNLFNCYTKWGQPEWGGTLCSAKHSSSSREVTAGSMSTQWVWKPCFGVLASMLDHKCLFWSQLYLKPSWENIFYMAVFQEVVYKPARSHHKKATSKPYRSHPSLIILFPHTSMCT